MKWLEKFDKTKKIKIPDFGKKAISLLTAFALLTVSIPASEVVNGMSYLAGEIKAAAAADYIINLVNKTCDINTAEQLVQFSKDYKSNSSDYKDLTISIGISQGDGDIDAKFESIGTSEYPFSGTVLFTSNTPIYLDKALFDYISDSAVITGNIIIGKKEGTNMPLFANKVSHTTDSTATVPKDWNITAKTYTDSSDNEDAYDFAGVIGTIETGAKVSLKFTNNATKTAETGNTYANISNDGNAGLACQTMGKNSSLDFTLDSTSTNTAYNVTAAGGNAGGIVGTMESGANLTLNNSISSTGEVKSETGYAGGVVGYATDATVTFADSTTTVNATVNGSSGTGGVFGYYLNPEGKNITISNYNVTCTVNGAYLGGIFGVLENNGTMTIDGTNKIDASRTTSSDNDYFGGLIGTYSSDNTSRTLNVNGVTVKFTVNQNASNYYGGIIGLINSACYIKISGVKASEKNKPQNFGGLVGKSSLAFIDAENITVTTGGTFTGGGIVGYLNSGVLRLSGTTNFSGARIQEKNGQIVGTRGQALIYAESGWKLIRSATSSGLSDDIKTWGEVLRFNDTDFKETAVLTEDTTNHTITVNAANTTVSSLEDFAILALNIQLNTGTNAGTLQFANSTDSKSSTILGSTINLNTDIDLSGTGITGLTRDDGANNDFTGTFNGNSHKISLAIGECYGDRLTEGTPAAEDEINNGRIYTHQYNGLFAETGNGAQFNDLTISGSINLNDNSTSIKAGGLTAVHNSGSIKITSVNVDETINLKGSGSDKYTIVGGMIGQVANNANPEITITGGTISPIIKADDAVNHPFYTGGAIGEITSTNTITATIDGVTIGANITNNSPHVNKKIGGLIAYISNLNGTMGARTMNLTNITVDGASVTAKSGGGLLGDNWNNVEVTVGSETNPSAKGLEVTNNSTISSSGDFAGLVNIATGYWKVYNIDINSIDVVGSSATSFGMLVNKGINLDNSQPKALYLELENENAYTINNSVAITLGDSTIFDELVATCTGNYADDVSSNGRAIVSIHTSGDKLNMEEGTSCNTYQNQTGRDISNPNTRYYYNLDVIRKNPANDSEKLLLWSVYKYAHSSLSSYFPNPFENENTIPSGDYDMKGYSYYPIDIDSNAVTISYGANFTFYNDKIDERENDSVGDSLLLLTTDEKSQHHLMHYGLFRNVSNSLTANEISFAGSVYSGALVCGKIEGSSTSDVTVTLDGIRLKGVTANSSQPLLVNTVGSYVKFDITDVTTPSGYTEGQTAATSLIGDVGSDTAAGIRMNFSKIVLDGRKQAISDATANSALNTAYNTTRSIFTESTLLKSFMYPISSDCSAAYNYKHSEDWDTDGNPIHQVTYGTEISSSEEYKQEGQQTQYVDKKIFTDPTMSDNESEVFKFDPSEYLPYVKNAYTTTNNYHEIKINHKSPAILDKGCGTYNDPYIIYDDMQLKVVADILAGNDPQEGFVVNYTKEKDNYKSWCAEKTGHTPYTYHVTDGSGAFEGSGAPTVSTIRTALSTAYYKLDDNLTSDIELPDTFLGLGKSTPFKGVIDGSDKTIINNSTNPLIYNSTGSVVKDLTVKVAAALTSLDGGNTATKYLEDGGSTPFYGGIFGIVNGGDNIIDKVSVTFSDVSKISSSGTYAGNVAVGGYVGVVRYGGVIFRHMDGIDHSGITNNTNFNSDVNNNFKGGSDSKIRLYFNPIIGRVIDGYAFTETDHYTPRETSNPTMKNGTKNYSIADIDNTTNIISISDDKTISVPNGQSLFLMGCIAMSGAGSATASNTAYTTTTDKTYSYGNNQMVRHADYKNIGTTDSTDSDYVLATSDEYLNTKVNVPYIISKYTSETNGNYPARTLTTDTFSINLEENGTYTLPDGFRGIGSLEKNSDNLQMKISRFDGKNCTVNLNMSYYTYEIGKDSTIKYDVYTDNIGKYGLGLFNSLINNSNNSTIIISNLNISGNVISEIYKNENGDKAYGGNNYKDYKMLPVSGIIGGYKPDTKGNVTITNVNISGLDLKSNYISGGLIGYVNGNGNGKEGTLSINNCQSNGSGISATVGHYVGGMVGYVENNITVNIIGDETNKSEFIINKINSIGDYASSDKWHDTFSAGGLIGYAYNNCTYNVKFMEVTGDTIESFGVCGGIVGRAMNGKTATIDNCVVKGIDLYGSFVGGITGITRITTEIKNCKVIGDTNKNKMIAYNSAGGIFSFSMEKDCKIDNCLVENYIIKLTGEKSIAYPENVGGFVGKIQYKNYKLTINNSKISDCNIQNQDCLVYKSGDDAGTGGVIGHCESGMKLYGYNILLNNVSLTDESGNELTSKAGYIAGRNEDVINLVGFCINGVTFNKDFGTKSLTASAYVIYSDYNGECVTTQNDIASTINVKSSDVSAASPFATINPSVPINIDDSETVLTGDGISKTAIDNIIADTTRYTNVDTEKTKFSGDYSRKLSTFNTELGLGVENDFPVLIVNDVKKDNVTALINSYIHLLTNDSSIAKYDEKESGKYQVVISQYKYDSTTKKFTTSDTKTLNQAGTVFSMAGDNYDNTLGQFTLIDVQYFAPNTSNVAYHLYIPVVVEKMLNFEFKVGALSGTTYKADSYTSRLGLPVLENYGTPVTAYVTYSYRRTADEWASAINGGENILTNYGKSVLLKDYVFPSDTKVVLVDRNQKNKAYYYTPTAMTSAPYNLDFSNFKTSGGTTFESIPFIDLIEKSATITAEASTDGTLVKCESTDVDAIVRDSSGQYYKKKATETENLYTVTVTPTDSNVEINDILPVEENYYLSFFTNKNSTDGMRNISLTCASKLGDDGMTPSHKVKTDSSNNDDIVHIILGNLYDQEFTFSTSSDEKITETNNVINGTLSTKIKLKEEDKAKVLTYFGDSSIQLFHSFIIDATMTKEDKSTETGVKGNPAVSGTYKINGSAETNMTSELNGSVIEFGIVDIKDDLKNNPDGVTITCDDLQITYPDESDIIAQFPERKSEGTTIGTVYSAKSNLAYTTDNIQQSTISAEPTATDGKSYYRENILSAKLTYNIPSYDPNELTKLGVNGRDVNDDINAVGYYNVANLPQSALDKATQVKFTLSLEKKNDDGNGYTQVDNMDNYLTNVKLYGKDSTELSGESYVYTVNKESLTYESGSYVVDTVFNVITGNEFENKGYTYANYKVKLTAELLDSSGKQIENSLCEDYIIYTNAKIYTELITEGTQS